MQCRFIYYLNICTLLLKLLLWFSLYVLSDSAIPWNISCQPPLSVGFPREKCWSGLSFLSPGDLPDPRNQACVSYTGRQLLYHSLKEIYHYFLQFVLGKANHNAILAALCCALFFVLLKCFSYLQNCKIKLVICLNLSHFRHYLSIFQFEVSWCYSLWLFPFCFWFICSKLSHFTFPLWYRNS